MSNVILYGVCLSKSILESLGEDFTNKIHFHLSTLNVLRTGKKQFRFYNNVGGVVYIGIDVYDSSNNNKLEYPFTIDSNDKLLLIRLKQFLIDEISIRVNSKSDGIYVHYLEFYNIQMPDVNYSDNKRPSTQIENICEKYGYYLPGVLRILEAVIMLYNNNGEVSVMFDYGKEKTLEFMDIFGVKYTRFQDPRYPIHFGIFLRERTTQKNLRIFKMLFYSHLIFANKSKLELSGENTIEGDMDFKEYVRILKDNIGEEWIDNELNI